MSSTAALVLIGGWTGEATTEFLAGTETALSDESLLAREVGRVDWGITGLLDRFRLGVFIASTPKV